VKSSVSNFFSSAISIAIVPRARTDENITCTIGNKHHVVIYKRVFRVCKIKNAIIEYRVVFIRVSKWGMNIKLTIQITSLSRPASTTAIKKDKQVITR